MNASPSLPLGPVAIDRMRPVPPAQDFAALKQQALDWLPVWCAGIWTDFNAHDPGIMLLEQIVFALTELPYRAELPISRLLQQLPDGHIPWEENSLYPPTEVLPMAPLTADDYARLLYDRIPSLVYARVEAVPAADRTLAPGVGGRLRAKIAVGWRHSESDAPRSTTIDPPPAAAVEDAIKTARAVLESHCNLGERFDDVSPEPVVPFSLTCQVVIAQDADEHRVAADLFFALVQALEPGPHFRPLVRALEDETIDVALTGPYLNGGIIEDADLPRLLTWAEAQRRAGQAVAGVPGITAVTDVAFSLPGNVDPATPQRFLPGVCIAVTPPEDAPAGALERVISFGPPLLTQRLTAMNVSPDMLLLGSTNPRVHFTRLLPEPTWRMPPVPDEAVTVVGEYFSIQNEFPPCFCLQEGGVPVDATTARLAQIQQLKGYLLVYEQLLANYLAQLEHTADYFSNRPQDRTVFTQPLATVPGVMPMLPGYRAEDAGTTTAEQAAYAEAYWNNPANPYVTALRAQSEDEEMFLARRSGVLDQLLARFNETFAATDEAPTFETIRNKEDLLQDYRDLGYRRAQAADHSRRTDVRETRARSGLERKLELLLRRDTQPGPPPLGALAVRVTESQPADFYFVVEPIRFLPASPTVATAPAIVDDTADPASEAAPDEAGGTPPTPEPAAPEPATVEIPLAEFNLGLFHVFLNWTYEPLNDPFKEYVAALVRENAPAHLLARYVWFETQPHPQPEARKFLRRFRRWASDGYPTLELAAAPVAGGTTIRVFAQTSAARLFQLLRTQAPLPT